MVSDTIVLTCKNPALLAAMLHQPRQSGVHAVTFCKWPRTQYACANWHKFAHVKEYVAVQAAEETIMS